MIPDYQTLMLPLLQAIKDGKEYRFKEVIDIFATKFGLTEQEKNELLPSGQAFLFPNRVGWARTYLKKAGLISAPGRGIISITNRGQKTLSENLPEINVKY
jgi:restriction system protein